MRTKPLDNDGNIKADWHDEPDNTITIQHTQDVQPILEQNKREYNAYGDKRTMGKHGMMTKVASIPNIVLMMLAKKYPEFWTNKEVRSKAIKELLNDPEYKYLRTTPTRI